jgi:Ca2+-binding EF-hand superfamily protein
MRTKVGWQPSESFQKDFKDGLLDKIKITFPLVSKGLFRFFDADGSGFISKDEVMAIVNAFIKLADPAYQNLPMRERLKDIVEGLFRVFDSNGNGIIESFELNEIVSDVVSGIATIVATVIDYLEPHFLKEPLDGLARIYADKLLEKTGEEPFPTAKIVEFSLSSVPDSPEAFPSEEDIASQLAPLEAAIGPIGTKLEAVAAQYTAFLAKFDAQAEEGKLDKAKCVVFATESILELFESNFSPDDVSKLAASPLSMLNSGLARSVSEKDDAAPVVTILF